MDDADISLQDVLNAYRCGLFPMADSADTDEYHWYDPPRRGQLPIKNFHISRSLKRTLRKQEFTVTVDEAFRAVIDGCAERTSGRPQTWINKPIRNLFVRLHQAGYAHSVECWQNDELVGGIYGLAFGAVFAGESMFSRVSNASKVALAHLAARLWKGGFDVFDTQFVNEHLLQFGAYEISREEYLEQVYVSGRKRADFKLSKHTGLKEFDLINEFMLMST